MNQLWVEKYRPSRIKDCILPEDLKNTFTEFVDKGYVPNLLLTGGPGVGKTTVARAMLEECGFDYIIINGSMNGNIDTLRTDIKNFASTVSLTGSRKYVILDEADYLNPQSTQPALRGFIEEFSANCGFILTCNYVNRIIPALVSRCPTYDFAIPKDEEKTLQGEFFLKALNILKQENVEYEKRAVVSLVQKHFPDWRRVLNELQRYSVSGKIDAGVLVNISTDNMNQLIGFMKNKEFTNVREWVVQNLDNDPTRLFRSLYDTMYDHMDGSSLPHVVVILGEYQYKSAFVADQEINTLACLTEIMARGKFK